jgi:hypothetical protein
MKTQITDKEIEEFNLEIARERYFERKREVPEYDRDRIEDE